jgi:hypothetical protein
VSLFPLVAALFSLSSDCSGLLFSSVDLADFAAEKRKVNKEKKKKKH